MERKRNVWIRRTVNEAAGTITFQPMTNGTDEKPIVAGDGATFTLAKASDACRAYAALHGFNQRIGDAAAKDAGTSVEEKMDAIRDMIAHYESGSESWTLKATRAKADPEALLAQLLANDPERLAQVIAAAQAKLANAAG